MVTGTGNVDSSETLRQRFWSIITISNVKAMLSHCVRKTILSDKSSLL